jgi:hypothetical protein
LDITPLRFRLWKSGSLLSNPQDGGSTLTFQNDPQNRFFFLTRHNDVPPNSAASTKTLLPKYKNVILTRKAGWGRLLEAEAVYE